MKKLLLFLLCLGTFVWGQSNADDANAPALTIYNQNFFVAREHLPLDLHAGINQIAYAGVAAHLEPDSVILRDPDGRALQISRTELPQRPHLSGTVVVVLRREDHRFPGRTNSGWQADVGERKDHSQWLHSQQLLRAETINSQARRSRSSKSMASCVSACRDNRCSQASVAIQS
jgi:hypothetical protein